MVTGSLIVAAAVVILVTHHRARDRQALADGAAERFRGFASGPARSGGGQPAAESPQAVARAVDGTMLRWRNAVVAKDAETVVALDLTFRQLPDRYADALARSAATDANERVRAFSTRVLGGLRRSDLLPLYERLLADPSVYVRQNAAWAVGELGATGAGHAVAELRQLRARDPADAVRAAAKNALAKLD
jgi:HEAT repeat protein